MNQNDMQGTKSHEQDLRERRELVISDLELPISSSVSTHTSPRFNKYKTETENSNTEENSFKIPASPDHLNNNNNNNGNILNTSGNNTFENNTGINSIRKNFASRTVQLADENVALKTQLNNLLRDNGDLWEQKLELTKQVGSLTTENTELTQLVESLKNDLQQAVDAKQALEKRSYTLNDLLDVSAESQLILKAETETLSSDLSKCRIQKTTLTEQLSATLKEVSILGNEITYVKEKNYNLLQQLASLTTPSPSEVIKSLINYNNVNSPPPYYLLHQFRRLKQKKQLLEAALEVPDPTILKDVVITLHTGLTDEAFAELINLYPEAKNLYISHMTSLGLSAWPTLLRILPYLKMPYEEGMLRLKIGLMEPDPTSRQLALSHCLLFLSQHECLQWEHEQLANYMNQIYSD